MSRLSINGIIADMYYVYIILYAFLHAIVLSHCKYLYILKEDPREDWTVSNWALSLNKVIIIITSLWLLQPFQARQLEIFWLTCH